MDAPTAEQSLRSMIPMVETLDLRVTEMDTGKCVMLLPEQPAYFNHIGKPHAGAMFTLGESASGGVVVSELTPLLDRGTPLVVEITIRYLKIARGDITAVATMSKSAEEIEQILDDGGRPEWVVDIDLIDGTGTKTGSMTALWTIKPH